MAIVALPAQFQGIFRIQAVLNGNILVVEDVKMQSASPWVNGTPLSLKVSYGVSFSIVETFTLTQGSNGWNGQTSAYDNGTYRVTLQGDSDTDEYLVGYFPFQSSISMCKSGNSNTPYYKNIEMDNIADTVKVYWSHHTGDNEVVNPIFSIDGKSTWDIGDSSEYPYPLSKTYTWAQVYEAASIMFRIGGNNRVITPGVTSNATITSYNLAARNVGQRFKFYKQPEDTIPFKFTCYKVGSPLFTLRVALQSDNGSNEPGTVQGYVDLAMWQLPSSSGEVSVDIPVTGNVDLDANMFIRLIVVSPTTNNASNHVVYEYNNAGDEYVDGGMTVDQGLGYSQQATDNLICEITNNYLGPVSTCEYGAVVLGEPSDEDCLPDVDINLLHTNCTRFVLTDTITPIEIREPVGWDAVEIIYKRDEKYLGVLVSYTSGDQELSFGSKSVSGYTCSKKYLDDQYDLEGIDAYVEFKFQILIDATWYNLFTGICDFYERERTPDFTMMPVRRISFDDQFKNLIGTAVDVLSDEDIRGNPAGAATRHDVVLHSRHVRKTFYAEKSSISDINGTYDATTITSTFLFIPNNIILDNIEKRFNYGTDQQPGVGWVINALEAYPLFELEMTGPMWVEMHVELITNEALAEDFYMVCYLDSFEAEEGWGGYGTEELAINYEHFIDDIGGGLYKHTFIVNEATPPGDWGNNYLPLSRAYKGRGFYLGWRSGKDTTEVTIDETCTGSLRIWQDTMDFNTINKLAYADDLMQAVAHRISTAAVNTNYLANTTERGKIMFCGGLELKGIRDNWFVSFEQIITGLQMMFDVGMGIKKVCPGGYEEIFVEERQHFFQGGQILQIDECEEYAEVAASEFVWNEIRFGYSNYQKDSDSDDNALLGYCSEQTRVTPIKYHDEEMGIICDFIADHYMIEDYRRQRHDAQEDKRSQPEDREVFAANVDTYTTKTFDYKAGYRVMYSPADDDRVLIFGEIINYIEVGQSIQLTATVPTSQDISFSVTAIEYDEQRLITFLSGYSGAGFQMAWGFDLNFIVSKKMVVRDEEFTLSDDIVQPSSIYNARYTPLELLYNNEYRIAPSLSHKSGTEGYKFTSGAQNFESSINPSDRGIKKALNEFVSLDDVKAINNSSATQAQPLWVQFICEIGFAEVLLIEKAFRAMGTGVDYGYISVMNPETNEYVDGWLYEMSFLPGVNRAKFKLLRAEQEYLEYNNIVQEDNVSDVKTENTTDNIIQE